MQICENCERTEPWETSECVLTLFVFNLNAETWKVTDYKTQFCRVSGTAFCSAAQVVRGKIQQTVKLFKWNTDPTWRNLLDVVVGVDAESSQGNVVVLARFQ